MENLILFGGSFDPIHNGHLRIARAAALHISGDVIFVPNKKPRWKNPRASAKDRLNMVKLALKSDGGASFRISTFEMDSPDDNINYSIDTVTYYKAKYPKHHLYFLIGSDSVRTFPEWKDAEQLAKLATPLYVKRPGFEVDETIVKKYHMEALEFDRAGKVSSTDIRHLRSGDIPSCVSDYIEKHELYYMQDLKKLMSEHRYYHSISVARTAYAIALNNPGGPDKSEAYIAGLIHDIGKDIAKDEQRKIMEEEFSEYLDMPEWAYHQFVGVHVAKTEFGITDPAILNAIEFHATGKAHMSDLGMIVYAADKIEPTRGYNSKPLIKACNRSYYLGFVKVLEANRDFFAGKGSTIESNRLSVECVRQYLKGGKKE